ncbi:MAG: putative NADH-flavin reductase [Oceanicoccus sp.]|jgi:putative NADH-flavin reductase
MRIAKANTTINVACIRTLVIIATTIIAIACTPVTQQPLDSTSLSLNHVEKNGRTIALLGATGKVGDYILQQALLEGYAIKALARTPAKLARYQHQITIVPGDALDSAVIRQLLEGSDVVISALGPVKADGDSANYVNSTASATIIQQMQAMGLKRYIVVSGAAISLPEDKPSLRSWLMKSAITLSQKGVLVDKQLEYKLLADSSIEWTLLRCPVITLDVYQQDPIASMLKPPSFQLRAGELARFTIEQIKKQQFIRQAPYLGSR